MPGLGLRTWYMMPACGSLGSPRQLPEDRDGATHADAEHSWVVEALVGVESRDALHLYTHAHIHTCTVQHSTIQHRIARKTQQQDVQVSVACRGEQRGKFNRQRNIAEETRAEHITTTYYVLCYCTAVPVRHSIRNRREKNSPRCALPWSSWG